MHVATMQLYPSPQVVLHQAQCITNIQEAQPSQCTYVLAYMYRSPV